MTKNDIDALDKATIRFTADWCAPCKVFAPTYDKVRNDFLDISSIVVNVGTDDGQDLAKAYGVLGIPAVVFLKKGQVVSLMAGNQPTEVVRKEFQKLNDL